MPLGNTSDGCLKAGYNTFNFKIFLTYLLISTTKPKQRVRDKKKNFFLKEL